MAISVLYLYQDKERGYQTMTLIVIHDNGCVDKDGFTDHIIKSESEIPAIINGYKEAGITVHDYFIESE